MIFKAVVLDNSMFFTRGTVRVRIAGFYNKKIVWNLAEDKFPETLTEGDIEGVNTQFSNDYEAQISSAFGGGRNYGSVVIPQINEKGIVAFLNGDKKNPVWLGGLFETFRDDSFNVEYVNFPTDKFVDGENSDGVLNGEGNIGDDVEPQEEKSIIIRTKHTTSNSVEEIEFQQQDTSNIISVGKKRIRVTHFPEGSWEDGEPKNYRDIMVGVDEENEDVIRIIRKDVENDKSVFFEIRDGETNISVMKEGELISDIKLTEEDIELKFKENTVKLNDEGIVFNIEEGEVTVNSEITNVSGNVKIAGAGDSVALYSDLIDIIEKFEEHIHVAPSGPTSAPLEGNKAPLAPGLIGSKRSMQSTNLETD